MNALVEARRIDLVVNVLRGYNPGGRVYALLALQHLGRSGFSVSQSVAATMRRVQNLKVPVSTCFGCFENRGLRAVDAVKWWREYERTDQ
jgi:hypothetical protein